MAREAKNGALEWMVGSLELHGVGELWILVWGLQGHLLLHKQFLSASFIFRGPFFSRKNFLDSQGPQGHPSICRTFPAPSLHGDYMRGFAFLQKEAFSQNMWFKGAISTLVKTISRTSRGMASTLWKLKLRRHVFLLFRKSA